MVIGDEKIGIELFLQLEEILKGTKVIAKVQFAGGTNPTHHHFFHKYKITKIEGDLDEKPMNGCIEPRSLVEFGAVGVFLCDAKATAIEVFAPGGN